MNKEQQNTDNFTNMIAELTDYINNISNKEPYLTEKKEAVKLLGSIEMNKNSIKGILNHLRNKIMKCLKVKRPHETTKCKLSVWVPIFEIFKKHLNAVR